MTSYATCLIICDPHLERLEGGIYHLPFDALARYRYILGVDIELCRICNFLLAITRGFYPPRAFMGFRPRIMDTEDHAHGYQQGMIPPHSPLPSFVSRSSGARVPAAPQGETSENGMYRSCGNCQWTAVQAFRQDLVPLGFIFLFTLPHIISLSSKRLFLALGYNLKYIPLRIHPIGTSYEDGQLSGSSQNVPRVLRCLNFVLCNSPCYTA